MNIFPDERGLGGAVHMQIPKAPDRPEELMKSIKTIFKRMKINFDTWVKHTHPA
jgi:hypothetical protein